MTEKLEGTPYRCGGYLQSDHKTWPDGYVPIEYVSCSLERTAERNFLDGKKQAYEDIYDVAFWILLGMIVALFIIILTEWDR